MKKVTVLFFILSLLITGFGFSRVLAAEGNPEAVAMAQEFSQKAMNEFRLADHPQLDQVAITSKMDEYAQKFAGILLDAGVDPKTTGTIMQQASVWYGQSLEELFNAKPYNAVIQAYSDKIADLFNRQHLTMDTQSKIVDITSDNLESFNDLFNPMDDIDQ